MHGFKAIWAYLGACLGHKPRLGWKVTETPHWTPYMEFYVFHDPQLAWNFAYHLLKETTNVTAQAQAQAHR